jgi:hypothetical protein
MSKQLWVAALIVSAPASALASARWVSLPELVRVNDTAVVATLAEVEEHSSGGVDHGRGTLYVERVLFGQHTAGAHLELYWNNPTNRACPRVEHGDHAGTRSLWLLETQEDGTVRATDMRAVLELKHHDVSAAIVEVHKWSERGGSPNPHLPTVLEFLEIEAHVLREEAEQPGT